MGASLQSATDRELGRIYPPRPPLPSGTRAAPIWAKMVRNGAGYDLRFEASIDDGPYRYELFLEVEGCTHLVPFRQAEAIVVGKDRHRRLEEAILHRVAVSSDL